MAEKIMLADSNPSWKDYFKAEKKKIKAILKKNCVSIHHIGSTAVRGLKAKPVIDILVIVNDISKINEFNLKFQNLGYVCESDNDMTEDVVLLKNGEKVSYQMYLLEKSNEEKILRYLAVCEYLENHPKKSREYAELKTKLVHEECQDEAGYNREKANFLNALEKDAVQWKKHQNNISIGMAKGIGIGVAIGSAYGLMIGNITMGMCYGMCLGMLFGMAIGNLKDRD